MMSSSNHDADFRHHKLLIPFLFFKGHRVIKGLYDKTRLMTIYVRSCEHMLLLNLS